MNAKIERDLSRAAKQLEQAPQDTFSGVITAHVTVTAQRAAQIMERGYRLLQAQEKRTGKFNPKGRFRLASLWTYTERVLERQMTYAGQFLPKDKQEA